jgi:hypothetical protein
MMGERESSVGVRGEGGDAEIDVRARRQERGPET